MFVCRSCDARTPRWSGRCTRCGIWGKVEAVTELPSGAAVGSASGRRGPGGNRSPPPRLRLCDVATDPLPRQATGFAELDRVLGGGAVPGSTILIGGEPGIGKSTLLLAVAGRAGVATPFAGPAAGSPAGSPSGSPSGSPAGSPARSPGVSATPTPNDRDARAKRSPRTQALYVAGEEAPRQIALRARRLGIAGDDVSILDTTDPGAIAAALLEGDYGVVIVDSVQSMRSPDVDGVPGGPAQVRRAAETLVPAARATECVVILVGQVTKVGGLAGPRFLEHAVDAVLLFEGDRHLSVRALRGIKNRYGPTDEIGLFSMRDDGLHELRDASSLLLANRGETGPGSLIAAVVEGRRAFCVEIQALLVGRDKTSPRRRAQGMDAGRAELMVGLVDTLYAPEVAKRDVFLNVVGGLRVEDRGLDLAVAAAVLSAQLGFSVPEDAVLIGELGLRGEVRPVARMELRLKEAKAMGFKQAFVPPNSPRTRGLKPIELKTVGDLLRYGHFGVATMPDDTTSKVKRDAGDVKP